MSILRFKAIIEEIKVLHREAVEIANELGIEKNRSDFLGGPIRDMVSTLKELEELESSRKDNLEKREEWR